MAGAPRFLAAFGDAVSRGQGVELLERVFHGDAFFPFRADRLAECLLDVAPDHEHDLIEPALHGVVDGIVEDDLAVRPDRVDLLESAVAASHSGGEHHQRHFFHVELLFM